MFTPTAPKSDRIILTIKTPTVSMGHMPHRSGSGKHGDRRQKRLKTRRNIVREAMRD